MAELEGFEPLTLMMRLDRMKKGRLDASDFSRLFKNHNKNLSTEQAHLFVKRFDIDKDGCLNTEEFLESILPSKSFALRNSAMTRSAYYIEQNETLAYEVEYSLMRVIEQEINLENTLEYGRDDLA
jgi:hypothetical protein